MSTPKTPSKAQIYDALCCLRLAARQVLGSLCRLEGAGFDLTFATGFKLIAIELNDEANRLAFELANEIDADNALASWPGGSDSVQ